MSAGRTAVAALARVEGGRLLRHPIFLLGMATTTTAIVLASGELVRAGVPLGASDRTETVNFLAGDCVVMLGAAFWTFLATFLAASRARRDATEDLYAGQPVAQRTRTAAALLSVGWAGLAAAALIGVSTLVLVGVDGALSTDGMRLSVRPVELLQGPLYVVMAGSLGVLLGSWSSRVYLAAFAAVVLFLPPVALVPWLVLDDDVSRGFYGAIMAGPPVTWRIVTLAALTALAASAALARSDRCARVVVPAGFGLATLAAVAIAVPGGGLAAGCSPQEGSVQAANGLPPRGTSGVPEPPQGRFAAVTDMCSAGSRLLYRDLELDGRRSLRFTIHYRSFAPSFAASATLSHREPYRNHQLRVDVMDPDSPILSVAAGHVLATVFRTERGDRPRLTRTIGFDLSRWADRTVRLRFAEVDNDGPLRVVVDDVRLDPPG